MNGFHAVKMIWLAIQRKDIDDREELCNARPDLISKVKFSFIRIQALGGS